MTKENEITPELIESILDGIVDENQEAYPKLQSMAFEMAEAYLAKCEEVETIKNGLNALDMAYCQCSDERDRLQAIIDDLLASRTLWKNAAEYQTKEKECLQAIIDKQQIVLGLVSQAFHLMGLSDEEYLVGRVRAALALTTTDGEGK